MRDSGLEKRSRRLPRPKVPAKSFIGQVVNPDLDQGMAGPA